jgi:putative DNA primase/helicase
MLPGLDTGGDVLDWAAAGGTAEQLWALVDRAPHWIPPIAYDTPAPDADDGKARADAETQALIDELARLNRLEYERRRRNEARQRGVRASALDDAVERRRAEIGAERGPAPLFGYWVVEPWGEPVDGDTLLRAIITRIRGHVVLTSDEATTVALWIMMAWVRGDAAAHSPILLATSPEPNSGKTTLINLVGFLVPRGRPCVGISEAALFRSVEMYEPTVLVDEADTQLTDNEPLRAVINSGWTRGQGVLRCVGDDNTPHLFPTFCPKALGMKGRKLPDTTLSRCIVINLKRKKPSDRPEHFKHIDDVGLGELRRQCMRWAIDATETLKVAAPQMPAGFDNRLGDNWCPLLAIADLAGGEWPDKARQAAITVSNAIGADDVSIGIQLLADIRLIFELRGTDRLTSTDLAEALGSMDERPWGEWKGGNGKFTKNALARLLRSFAIYPDTIRAGTTGTAKGYMLVWYKDAFESYLSSEEGSKGNVGSN